MLAVDKPTGGARIGEEWTPHTLHVAKSLQ